MSTFNAITIDLLDRFSPEPGRQPDWSDVLDRAGLGAKTRSSYQRWGRRAAVTACVAATAVTLALVWPFAGSRSVVSQALAAIGNGRATHAVLETSLGSSLVSLDTGKRTPVHEQTNIWSDPNLGLVVATTFQGSLLDSFYLPLHAANVWYPVDFTVGLISGYRAALKSGAYHLVGTGALDGKPVDWIATKPGYRPSGLDGSGPIKSYVQQVAISRSTYKPLYFRSLVNGRVQNGESTRVVSIQTGPANPTLFTPTHTRFLGYGYTPTSPSTTVTEAAAAMHRQPLIPPTKINSLARSWIGQPRYSSGNTLQTTTQFPAGIEFFYGKLDDTGTPAYSGANFISITEYPRPNAVIRALGTVRFPSDGQALLQQDRATLETHGYYVIIDAGSPAAAVAAAQALR
jgi:hypothetical protein